MPKRSNRLPLLAILCLALAILCVAAILIWMNFGGKGNGEEGAEKEHSMGPSKMEGNEENGKKTTMGEKEEMEMMTEGPPGIKMTTTEGTMEKIEKEEMEFEASTNTPPWTMAEIRGHSPLHAPVCLEPPLEGEMPGMGECGKRAQQSGSPIDADYSPVKQLRPFEYSLNISLPPVGQPTGGPLRGQLSILVELLEPTTILALNFGQHLGNVDKEQVRIWDCQRGTFLCLRTLTRLPDQELLLLELAPTVTEGPLPTGSILRLQFLRLNVPLASPGLLVQIPSPWERDRAWILGTQLPLAAGARALFPSVDSAQARAVIRLCLEHPVELIARANTLATSSEELEGSQQQQQIRTCFKETPALPPAQFAFLLFRNLKQIPPQGNSKAEMFIGSHLQPEDYGWVLEEAEKAMRRMEQFTGVAYPAERLTLISSPLAPGNDTVGGLGLAQIRDSWIEYPKFVHTHDLLIGQIVRQWTANLLSLCDECLQRGIGLFLEWVLAAELGPAEDKAAEFRRRIGEARQRLLGSGQQMRTATAPSDQCAERTAFVLHSLDRAFDRGQMVKFLTSLFRRHSWDSKCTSTGELSALWAEAAQGHPEAKQVFDSFLSPTPSSSIPPPLLHFQVQPQMSQLLLTQQHLDNQTDEEEFARTIPVEVVDDTGKSSRIVLNQTKMAIPMVISSFLLAQPSSFARYTYNVENYLLLSECLGQEQSGKCPSVDRLALRDAVNDLCWALLHQKLTTATPDSQLPLWRQLFQALTVRGAVHGDCACCMMPEAEALRGHCRWTWLDKCSRIELLTASN